MSDDDPIRRLFGLKADEYYNLNRSKINVVDVDTQANIRAFIRENLDTIIQYGKIDCTIDDKQNFVLLVKTPKDETRLLSKFPSLFMNCIKVNLYLGSILINTDIPNELAILLRPNRGYFVYGQYREKEDIFTERVYRNLLVQAIFPAEEFASPEQQVSADINQINNTSDDYTSLSDIIE